MVIVVPRCCKRAGTDHQLMQAKRERARLYVLVQCAAPRHAKHYPRSRRVFDVQLTQMASNRADPPDTACTFRSFVCFTTPATEGQGEMRKFFHADQTSLRSILSPLEWNLISCIYTLHTYRLEKRSTGPQEWCWLCGSPTC